MAKIDQYGIGTGPNSKYYYATNKAGPKPKRKITGKLSLSELLSAPAKPSPKPAAKAPVKPGSNSTVRAQEYRTPSINGSSSSKKKSTTSNKKSTPTRSVNSGGGGGSSGGGGGVAAPPPIDPLTAMQNQYSAMIDQLYTGLAAEQGKLQQDYRDRSTALAGTLKGHFDTGDQTINQSQDAASARMNAIAERLGIGSGLGTIENQDRLNQDSRIDQLNALARSSSLSNFDLIRENYAGFLGDKVSQANASKVQSELGLADLIQQLRMQAAASAGSGGSGGSGGGSSSRGRSSGGRSSSSRSRGSSSGSGKTATQAPAMPTPARTPPPPRPPVVFYPGSKVQAYKHKRSRGVHAI